VVQPFGFRQAVSQLLTPLECQSHRPRPNEAHPKPMSCTSCKRCGFMWFPSLGFVIFVRVTSEVNGVIMSY
jgi:hypothetical protein